MIEWIEITFVNGDIFHIPALYIGHIIAEHAHKCDDTFTKQEYLEDAMKDCYDLCDWLKNNMDWKDVEDIAIEIKKEPFNYHKGFGEADTRCVWSD